MNVHFVTLKSCFDAAILVWQEPNMNLWDLINQWNECRGRMHYDVTANRAARSSPSTATLSALAKVAWIALSRSSPWMRSCDANNIGSSSALAQGTLVTWVTHNNRLQLKPMSMWTARSHKWLGEMQIVKVRKTATRASKNQSEPVGPPCSCDGADTSYATPSNILNFDNSGVIIRTHDWN